MRVMAIAVVAAFAVGAISTADAAPRKSKRQYVEPAPVYVPATTYVMHRDEYGRTRTKILVQKRSYLDGGTEVMPGDISGTNRENLINSFSYNPSSASVSNAGIAPPRPVPDPFFLPGKNNPFFN
jgi:hypothetical protein